MKKKIIAAFTTLAIGVGGLVGFPQFSHTVEAAPKVMNGTPIEITGEAKAEKPDAKRLALLNAKKRAVKKALQQIGVTPSKEADSRYVKLSNNCESYISDEIKVVSYKQFGGKQLAFCIVPVDVPKLNADADKLAALEQRQEFDDKPIFLIRVTGLGNDHQRQTIPNNVQNIYAQTFRDQGFAVGSGELGANGDQGTHKLIADAKNANIPYDTYKDAVKEIARMHVDIPIIVVGEIKVTKTNAYAASGYAEADCHFDVLVRNENNTLQEISCFSDYYNASRVNVDEAIALVARTAALNSAQRLADATYNFWIKR